MVALAAVLLWTTQANASVWTVYSNGVRYQIDGDKAQATIMGLQSGSEDITELVFPSWKVAGGDSYDYPIRNVNIQAFYNSKLQKVDMSKLTSLREFDHNCFANSADLKEVILPEGLTSLGISTFKGCSSLEEITLPSTLKSIGSYVFEGTAIKELTIPASVTYVGSKIFAYWDDILRINMENPVPPTGFDKDAFSEALRRRPDLVLFVPAGSVGDYQASDWWSSRFTNIKSDDLGDVFNYGHFRYELKEYIGTRYVEIVGVADDYGVEYDWMLDMDGVQYDGRIYPVWYVKAESCKDYRWEELDLSRNMFQGLRSVSKDAFNGNATIKTVKLHDNMTYLGESAFAWCSNLETVVLPYNLEKIDFQAFKRCTNLKKVSFGPKLLTIKERAFDECWSLEYVWLPAGLLEVGYRAFYGTGIEWIVLPPSVPMGYESLLSCNKLKYIFPMYDDPTACTSPKNIFFMNDSPGKLSATLFVPNGKLDAYKASDWGQVFSDIRDTTEGLILDNDTVTMRLDDNIQWFVNTSSGFPDYSPFLGKSSITGISPNFKKGDIELHGLYETYFKGVNALGPFLVYPTKIATRAFKDNKQLTSIDLSDMYLYLEIGYQAFAGCTNLRSIGNENNYTCAVSIADEAFMGSGLEKFQYYSLTANIGNKAFANCPNLKEVDYLFYNSNTVNIGNGAFQDCKALEQLELGTEVAFGYDCFANCTGLKRVTSFDNTPSAFDESVFSGVEKESVPLFVPPGTVGTYKATAGWKDFFGNNIKDTNEGTVIDDGVFTYEIYNNGYSIDYDANVAKITGLSPDISTKKAVMAKSAITMDGRDYPVDLIVNNAFENLVYVDEMDFTAAEQSIDVGYEAFHNAKSLKHIKFNEKVGWTMSSESFAAATGLEDIVITSDVAPSAFSGCTKLNDVRFTTGCTSIGDYSFYGCTSLQNMSLPKGDDLSIFDNAFEGSGLMSLTIPNYSTFYIFGNAFLDTPLIDVTSYIEWPSDLDSDAFNGIPADATLKVPYGMSYEYEYKTGWNHFYGHIEEMPYIPTGIQNDAAAQQSTETVYDLQGRRMADNPATLKKGIYIIGGKKVMVK